MLRATRLKGTGAARQSRAPAPAGLRASRRPKQENASRGGLAPRRALNRHNPQHQQHGHGLGAPNAISLDRVSQQPGDSGRREWASVALDVASRPFAKVQRGLESRLEADDEFLFKLLWEIVQDQIIIVLTVVGTCGFPALWTPEQFANACLLHATAFFNDILLMWFLAATTSRSGGDQKSAGAAAELSHMFQPSETATISDRLKCWLDKFFLYAPLGLFTAVLSARVMSGFLSEAHSPIYLAKVGLVGLLHLGISSNTRYQLINGADVLYYRVLDKNAARAATIGSRLINQVAGGKLFLLLSTFVLSS